MFINKNLFFISCLATSLFADSPKWTFSDTSLGWNSSYLARTYFHNSEMQRQWAWNLVGKVALNGNESILDFGCGDGKITSELSHLVMKGGSILGVDISDEMIRLSSLKFPNRYYPNLRYQTSDSMSFTSEGHRGLYDLITSFCVFHLIEDPVIVLQNLKMQLKPNGKLLLVVPENNYPQFFQAAEETFIKHSLPIPWKQTERKKSSMGTVVGAVKILDEAGFVPQLVERVDTPTVFYDADELYNWLVGTMAANWNIPSQVRHEFFQDVLQRLFELDPDCIDENGVIELKLFRINVVATPLHT